MLWAINNGHLLYVLVYISTGGIVVQTFIAVVLSMPCTVLVFQLTSIWWVFPVFLLSSTHLCHGYFTRWFPGVYSVPLMLCEFPSFFKPWKSQCCMLPCCLLPMLYAAQAVCSPQCMLHIVYAPHAYEPHAVCSTGWSYHASQSVCSTCCMPQWLYDHVPQALCSKGCMLMLHRLYPPQVVWLCSTVCRLPKLYATQAVWSSSTDCMLHDNIPQKVCPLPHDVCSPGCMLHRLNASQVHEMEARMNRPSKVGSLQNSVPLAVWYIHTFKIWTHWYTNTGVKCLPIFKPTW